MNSPVWPVRFGLRRFLAVGIVLYLGLAGWPASADAGDASHESKVGLVTSGGLDDPFNHLVLVGLNRAEDKLHVQTNVLQSFTPAQYEANLTTFANLNYDLVITFGFLAGPAVGKIATSYPNVHFAILDGVPTDASFNPVTLPNVEGVMFKEEESGALVGVISGMLEASGRAPRSQNVVSAIGGLSIPPVNHYIAGYKWGAQLVDPSVTVLVGYSNWFAPFPPPAPPGSPPPPQPCAGLAQSQIAGGADIIFPVAGGCGLRALEVAGQAGLYSIGVDLSQKSADPSVIVSALKRFDMATYDVIKAATDGGFQSGVVRLGLNDDATGYSVDNFRLPSDIRKEVARVERQIEEGALTPPTTF